MQKQKQHAWIRTKISAQQNSRRASKQKLLLMRMDVQYIEEEMMEGKPKKLQIVQISYKMTTLNVIGISTF